VPASRPAIPLIPEGDERQSLRLRRYLLATSTSLMVIALLYVGYLLGGLEWIGFVSGTGLNLKFRDASMTMPQLTSSIVTMAYVMYFADEGRAALLIVFLVAFLFGVFRLRTRQLLFLAAIAIGSYALMVLALYQYKPHTVGARGDRQRYHSRPPDPVQPAG
jgi:hypothetical protein